jgi:tetratricopeptide (TPR) repeat protein
MRRLEFGALLIFFALMTAPGESRCRSLDSMFNEANTAFWNGEFEKAADLYEEIELLGVRDPALSYNLATAYARQQKVGRAVQNYERVLRLAPGHGDALHNLAKTREYIARRASRAGRDADLAPAVSPWRAVLDRFTPSGAAYALLIFHVLLFLVLVVRRVVQREMPRLFLGVFAGILAIVTVLTLSVAIGKWRQHKNLKEAVVVTDGQLEIMEGPLSTVKRFGLEEGSRVEVMEEREEWIRLLDAEERDGWVPAAALGKI